MAYVNLSKMPSAKKEYVTSFDMLAGGLNLQELDYRIDNNESPEMKNLLWREGVLSCRDGQVWVRVEDDGTPVDDPCDFVCAYEWLWHGCMFVHHSGGICVVNKDTGVPYALYEFDSEIKDHGTFFAYNDKLYYKTTGLYVEITYAVPDPELDDNNDPIEPEWYEYFSADDVTGYVPVTYINCSPLKGSGTVYQPENRISAKKTLWYNAAYTMEITVSSTDLSASLEETYFRAKNNTPGTYVFTYTTEWTLGGESVDPFDYGITVGGTPTNGDTMTVVYAYVDRYYLPLSGLDVTNVTVNGTSKTPESITLSVVTGLTAAIDKDTWRSYVSRSRSQV